MRNGYGLFKRTCSVHSMVTCCCCLEVALPPFIHQDACSHHQPYLCIANTHRVEVLMLTLPLVRTCESAVDSFRGKPTRAWKMGTKMAPPPTPAVLATHPTCRPTNAGGSVLYIPGGHRDGAADPCPEQTGCPW